MSVELSEQQLDEFKKQLKDLYLQLREEIRQNLLRIANKTYGECIDCGQPISLQRLQAYPTAKRCLDCQEVYERTHAGSKGPTI